MSADRRIKLVLHYDGSGFFGWQRQRRERTVQGVLEHVLRRLCGKRLPVTAAGRTDTGVHATGQVASVRVAANWSPEGLRRSLNALAPRDLWIASAEEVPLEFHPRHDAHARTYLYRVGVGPGARSPFRRPWCWPLDRPLDMGRVTEATAALPGTHSFAAFAKAGQPERGDRCTVRHVEWRLDPKDPEVVELEITADRFLHHMVRRLVGTLAVIGHGRRPAHDIERLLKGTRGLRASRPAPAQGLFLTHVHYPETPSRRRAARTKAARSGG